jgi:hypothetical protein
MNLVDLTDFLNVKILIEIFFYLQYMIVKLGYNELYGTVNICLL